MRCRALPQAAAAVLLAAACSGAGSTSGTRRAVRSWAEQRHAGVVMQQWDLSCGAAAIATLLTHDFDNPVSERDAAEAMLGGQDPGKVRGQGGFSLLDLQEFAASRGYEANGYGQLTLQDLLAMAPAIVPVHLHGFDHFVVLRGKRGDRLLVADPAFGLREVSPRDFERAWVQIAFVIERDAGGRPLRTAVRPAAAVEAPEAAASPEGAQRVDREQATRALERALVQQGGSVLQPGSAELEPGLDYAYDDPGGGRHDRLLSQLSLRLGLPWEAQADLRLPYVLVERTVGLGRTSGLGDVELGLTKLLVHEQGAVPELLATGRWRASTGRSAGAVSPGSGAHGLEGLLTALVRDDPVVLVGSLYYVRNLPAHDVDLGDVVGLAFNANLAATPDTSLFVGLDVAAFTSLRVQGETVPRSEGLSGILNLGFGHILGSRLAMNLTAGIGVTRDAPRFQLALALPLRL